MTVPTSAPPTSVIDKDTRDELCTFRPYHLNGGPFFYKVEGVSRAGSEATLIVPGHEMLERNDDEDEDVEPADRVGIAQIWEDSLA